MQPRRLYNSLVERKQISPQLHEYISGHAEKSNLMTAAENASRHFDVLGTQHLHLLGEFSAERIGETQSKIAVNLSKSLPPFWAEVNDGAIKSGPALKVIEFSADLHYQGSRIRPRFYIEKSEAGWRIIKSNVGYSENGMWVQADKKDAGIMNFLMKELSAQLKRHQMQK